MSSCRESNCHVIFHYPPPPTPDDTSIPNTPFCQKAKQLADSVQCVMILERPTVQPKRLVVTSVISSLLTTLMDSVASFSEFIASDLVYRPNGLK